ncbi:MAG TPA: hypothetical protein VGI20_00975 [Rhizomicrobium sp.]|jgi:predicted methyltransferase
MGQNNDPVGRMRALAKKPGRENVQVISADLVALPQRASIAPSMSGSSLVGFTSS